MFARCATTTTTKKKKKKKKRKGFLQRSDLHENTERGDDLIFHSRSFFSAMRVRRKEEAESERKKERKKL